MGLLSRLFGRRGGQQSEGPAHPGVTLSFRSDHLDPWYGELNEESDRIIEARQKRAAKRAERAARQLGS